MMNVPGHPVGYDVTKDVQTSRIDCHITVGFDKQGNHIPRFLVRLHYAIKFLPINWTSIARFDHNEKSASGHNIYDEGLHIDIKRKSAGDLTIHPSHNPIPPNRGTVIRACVTYFQREADYFRDVYEGNKSSSNPPKWPDGGDSSDNFLRSKHEGRDMRPEPRGDNTVSTEELSNILAEATGTTADKIEEGAKEFDIGPPEEADLIEPME